MNWQVVASRQRSGASHASDNSCSGVLESMANRYYLKVGSGKLRKRKCRFGPPADIGYQWWIFNNTFEALGMVIHMDHARRLVVAINSAWPEAESEQGHAAVSNFLSEIAKEIDKEKS